MEQLYELFQKEGNLAELVEVERAKLNKKKEKIEQQLKLVAEIDRAIALEAEEWEQHLAKGSGKAKK